MDSNAPHPTISFRNSADAVSLIPARKPALDRPVLFVVVDTETEFDWGKPFSRDSISVAHTDALDRFQNLCAEFHVRPLYLIDYSVATHTEAVRKLRSWHETGAAFVGTHLHTWLTPPFTEQVTNPNTYQRNLPPELELAKLHTITDVICANFGFHPRIHKAGRYGLGSNSGVILEQLGYSIDCSLSPGFDLTADGGPDWAAAPAGPHWLDREGGVLSLPTSGGFAGTFGRWGHAIFPWIDHPATQRLRMQGILSRLRLMARLRLSPEGYTLDDMKWITAALLARGVQALTVSFHSPSLQPGNTPYVRDHNDLEIFMQTLRNYLLYATRDLGALMLDPFEFRRAVEATPR